METFATGITGDQLVARLNTNFANIAHLTENYINVKELGAVGDNVQDDTSYFQDALELARTTNKPILIPPGRYKITSPLIKTTYTDQNIVCIIGMGNPILDFSDFVFTTTGDLIRIWGTTGEIDYADGPFGRGDTLIPMTNTNLTATLSKHDIIKINSNIRYVNPFTTNQFNGELCRVEEVEDSTNSIRVYQPLYDNYYLDSDTPYESSGESIDDAVVTVQKILAPKLILRDFTIIGTFSYNLIGINTRYTREVDIRNVTVKNVMNAGIYQEEVYEGVIDNCTIGESSLTGFGYGIANGPSYNMVIQNNHIYSCRHCVESGGNYPTRGLIIRNNYVTSERNDKAAIDNHTGVEDCLIEGNFCFGGGIYLRGINTYVINNTVFCAADGEYGIFVQDYGYFIHQNQSMIIRGNKVYDQKYVTDGNYGVMIYFGSSNDSIKYLEISDNKIESSLGGIYLTRASGMTGCRIETCKIQNNYIKKTSGSYACFWMNTTGVTHNNLMIQGNYFEGNYGGAKIQQTLIENVLVQNNIMISTTNQPPLAIAGTTTDAFVSGNRFENKVVGGAACNFSNIADLTLMSNVFKNMGNEGIIVAATVTVFTWALNRRIGCSGSISNAAGTTNAGDNF
jgi:hypothetical protein